MIVMGLQMPAFGQVPDDAAMRDQAQAESRDDLDQLIAHLRQWIPTMDPDVATARMTQGLIEGEKLGWTRIVLCSVLVEAVRRLTELP
jgi:hypothetical protein